MLPTHLSHYRIMWLFVMFDLPVGTKNQMKQATKFRNNLLDLGFEMSQFSIYLKHCSSGEKAEAISKRIQKQMLPPGGKVDILIITDKQFANMKRFYSQTQQKTDANVGQLNLF